MGKKPKNETERGMEGFAAQEETSGQANAVPPTPNGAKQERTHDDIQDDINKFVEKRLDKIRRLRRLESERKDITDDISSEKKELDAIDILMQEAMHDREELKEKKKKKK